MLQNFAPNSEFRNLEQFMRVEETFETNVLLLDFAHFWGKIARLETKVPISEITLKVISINFSEPLAARRGQIFGQVSVVLIKNQYLM